MYIYIYIYQSGCVRLDGFLLVVVIVVPLNSVRHPSDGQGNMARRSWLYCTSGASPRSRRLKLSRGLATRVLTCSDRDAEVRHEVQGYEDNRQGHDQGSVGGSACHQVGAQEEGLGLGHARIRFWSFLVLSHAGDHKSILILPAGCDVGAARALRNWCKRSLKDRQASRRLRRSFTLRADPHKQYSMKQHVGKVG